MNPSSARAIFILVVVFAAALWIFQTAPAFAHGGARGWVMLLPTGYYKVAAALAVAASFALLLCVPAHRLRWLEARSAPLFHLHIRSLRRTHWPSACSFGLLCALLLAGYLGNPDPLANPLPLFIWTLWWVGFTLLQCVFGDLWRWLNPWRAPLAVIRQIFPRYVAPLKPPRALGYAPAFILFLIFAWFELIDPAPDNPIRLAHAVASYWCFTLAACLLFGEKYWFQYAEPFAIFFRLIGGCSPLVCELARESSRGTGSARQGARLAIRLCLPGAQFITRPPLPLSGICFVLLTLSSVSFDGLNKTFTWLALLGINPLAFPGRSAVLTGNTLGLLLAFATLAALFFACVWTGCRLLQRANLFTPACGRLIYSLVPISLVFHLAHYLTALLTNTQYALLAFNDPFNLNWNLLAAKNTLVTTSFLNHPPSVSLIWIFQTLAIVLGHIIGITIAHLLALRLFNSSKTAAASQLPLAVLMVLYTLLGLWLLSTPAIA